MPSISSTTFTILCLKSLTSRIVFGTPRREGIEALLPRFGGSSATSEFRNSKKLEKSILKTVTTFFSPEDALNRPRNVPVVCQSLFLF